MSKKLKYAKHCTFQNVTFDEVTGVPTLGPVCGRNFKGLTFCYLHQHNAYLMAQQWLAVFKGTHPTPLPIEDNGVPEVKKQGRSVTFTIDFD